MTGSSTPRLGGTERAKAIREMAKHAKVPVDLMRETMLYAEEGHDIGSRGLWEIRKARDAAKFGRRQVSLHLPVELRTLPVFSTPMGRPTSRPPQGSPQPRDRRGSELSRVQEAVSLPVAGIVLKHLLTHGFFPREIPQCFVTRSYGETLTSSDDADIPSELDETARSTPACSGTSQPRASWSAAAPADRTPPRALFRVMPRDRGQLGAPDKPHEAQPALGVATYAAPGRER